MRPTPQKVWYKQFWPWFLIAVPFTSMILSLNMLRFAFNSEDSMVVDDYYKQGKGINVNLQKIEMAKSLKLKTQLLVSERFVELTFTNGEFASGAALTLNFYHVTQEHKDTSITLLKDANGTYRGVVETDLSGKWQVSLQPHDQQWKIQQTLSFPQSGPISFVP